MRICTLFVLLSLISGQLMAQDTLPKFSLRKAGNGRVIIGWVNPFQGMNQISIQRSHDSLKNYKTILTVADPKALQNGFADTKAPNDHMFYRIFYVLDGGRFYFTAAKKPDTLRMQPLSDRPVTNGVKTSDPLDSLAEAPKPVKWTPSFYVYTNKDGYVFINLPDAPENKYSLKFFEENDKPLFEIRSIKEKALILDKANFYHAGWFHFELYNGDKLVERQKFYLSKAF